jgi:hypothetical protein
MKKYRQNYVDRVYWFQPDRHKRIWEAWKEWLYEESFREEWSEKNWVRASEYQWALKGRDFLKDVDPCPVCGRKYGCDCDTLIDSKYVKLWIGS